MPYPLAPAPLPPQWPPAAPAGQGYPPPFQEAAPAPGFPFPLANAYPPAPPPVPPTSWPSGGEAGFAAMPPSFPAMPGWPEPPRDAPAAAWPPPPSATPPGPVPMAAGHPGPAQPPPRAAEADFALFAAVDHAMADLRASVNASQPAAGSLSELLRGIANATSPHPFSPDQR